MHLVRVLMMAAAVCTMAGCAQLRTNDGREGFVALAEAVPDAILEIRYYSTYRNFRLVRRGVPPGLQGRDGEAVRQQDAAARNNDFTRLQAARRGMVALHAGGRAVPRHLLRLPCGMFVSRRDAEAQRRES